MALRIAVFGLGYVGAVSAACFAERGHMVVGVDVSPDKVAMISQGRAPIVEDRVGELIAKVVTNGHLRSTLSASEAVAGTDIAFVCVGTPSAPNGGLRTDHLERVTDEIGAAMRGLGRRYTVVFRSTMLPGTCDGLLRPRLEAASGLVAGRDFGLAVNPEFLREGTSVYDFNHPPKTVVGSVDEETGDLLAEIYADLPGPTVRAPLAVAEMTKYVDNAFHALKVGFANEIGAVCKAYGLDSHAVMDIFRADTKLNISPAYLQPGFAFGGSCLPKDLRALLYHAQRADLRLPILEGVLPSNQEHITRVFNLVLRTGKRRVGLIGLAFKSGTDDLRESPMVELAERLLGRGFELMIHDERVTVSRLAGANREYLEARIPHLSRLMATSPELVVNHAEVCIVALESPAILSALRHAAGKIVLDLVRFQGAETFVGRSEYEGVAW